MPDDEPNIFSWIQPGPAIAAAVLILALLALALIDRGRAAGRHAPPARATARRSSCCRRGTPTPASPSTGAPRGLTGVSALRRRYARPMAVASPFYEKTDEQKAILEMVRQFVDEQILPKAEHYDHEDEFPEPIVEQMKELGLFGVTIPRTVGSVRACRMTSPPRIDAADLRFPMVTLIRTRGRSRAVGRSGPGTLGSHCAGPWRCEASGSPRVRSRSTTATA